MNKPKGKQVDFGNPEQAALVLHNAGAALLAKLNMGEEVTGRDLAEVVAYICLGFAGAARANIRPEKPAIVRPAAFR